MEVADSDIIGLLNGDEEKENNQDNIKTNMNELLCLTDAAVKALDSVSQPPKMGSGQPFGSAQSENVQLRSLSPSQLMGLYGDGEFDSHDLPNMNNSSCLPDVHERSSSKSSTAEDILIRSTVVTARDRSTSSSAKDLQESSNTSCLSARSDVSVASSGFLTGNARRVKVSSKKLKEVKSPFQNFEEVSKSEGAVNNERSAPSSDYTGPAGVTVSTGDIEPPLISIHQSNTGGASHKTQNPKQKEKKTHGSQKNGKPQAAPKQQNNAVNRETKNMKDSHSGIKQNFQVQCHITKEELSNILTKNNVEPKECSSTDESLNNSRQIYRDLRNDYVITDVQGVQYNGPLHDSQTSSKRSFDPDLMATTSSKINADAEVSSNASSKKMFGFTDTGSVFIEDVIAGAMSESGGTPSMNTSKHLFPYLIS